MEVADDASERTARGDGGSRAADGRWATDAADAGEPRSWQIGRPPTATVAAELSVALARSRPVRTIRAGHRAGRSADGSPELITDAAGAATDRRVESPARAPRCPADGPLAARRGAADPGLRLAHARRGPRTRSPGGRSPGPRRRSCATSSSGCCRCVTSTRCCCPSPIARPKLLDADICGVLLREGDEVRMRSCVGNRVVETSPAADARGQGVAGLVFLTGAAGQGRQLPRRPHHQPGLHVPGRSGRKPSRRWRCRCGCTASWSGCSRCGGAGRRCSPSATCGGW